MKKFFSTTTGRLLLGCLVMIIVVGISIAAVEFKKKKSGTNETTEVVLQENSETSVPMSDLPKEETPDAMSEAETSESEEAELSREENNTSNIPGTSVTTQGSAKPTVPVITPTEPENLSEDDLYYQNNSTVISVIKADESPDVQTEAEVAEALKGLGFEQYPITYEYSMGGEYHGDTEITNDPNTKRPMYETSFMTENGDFWTIFFINGVVLAKPISFNLESDLGVELLVSESKELTSYSDETNKFYVTIPNESAVIVKVIDMINADTLNKLSFEEIRDYEN